MLLALLVGQILAKRMHSKSDYTVGEKKLIISAEHYLSH